MVIERLQEFHQRHGATCDEEGLVEHFGDPAAELEAAEQAAFLADLSHRGIIQVTGADRAQLLHNLCTAEIKQSSPGKGTEAFFPDAKGKVLAYVTLHFGEDCTWIDTEPGFAEPLIGHLDRYVIREDVQLLDRAGELAKLHLGGPRAPDIVTSILGADPPAAPLDQWEGEIAGVPWVVQRHDRSRRPGFDLLIAADHAPEAWEGLLEQGREAGLRPTGSRVIEYLRIDAGLPAYGTDVTNANLPQEVNRTEEAISFTKGCYLGQETVARLDAMGHVNKLLRGLRVERGEAIETPCAIFLGEKEVGTLTSSAASPGGVGVKGLGILRTVANKPQTGVEIGAERIPAVVHELPFAD